MYSTLQLEIVMANKRGRANRIGAVPAKEVARAAHRLPNWLRADILPKQQPFPFKGEGPAR